MTVEIKELPTEMVPLEDLILHPDNSNEGDVGAIMEMIETNGWHGTITANRRTNRICAGNHRALAALQLGLKALPTFWVDVDEATERRILIADNRATRIGRNDEAALAEMLKTMAAEEGLTGTGYDGEDLDTLLRDLANQEGFNPNLNPSIHGADVTAEQVESERERLGRQFSDSAGQRGREVACPKCAHIFEVI